MNFAAYFVVVLNRIAEGGYKIKLLIQKTVTASLLTLALLISFTVQGTPITDPDDARSWQGATVGTFALLIHGSDTLANRQLIIDAGLLDDGLWIDPAGFSLGSYVKGGNGLGGTPNPNVLGFDGSTVDGTFAGNANARDFFWVQDTGNTTTFSPGVTGGRPSHGIVFDLGGQANQAVVFVQVDHGPLPGEVLENTAWLSNNPNAADAGWTQALLSTIYLEGWSPNLSHIADGFAVVYKLPTDATFQYVSVTHGGPGAILRDGDNEIDAVGGLTAQGQGVPEPLSIVLLGMGLLGLGFSRRRKTSW